ncbi:MULTISPECIES: hypothetical protein [unclassified Mesorhizobium]|uniref:hypothetical protein n=1 Tax=unclassified Mesorhizobium TaxID=325217 RepID=UPI001AECD9AD|nr:MULTISPECIES: hypothetical protein [unclassified Mesorhizobium]
MRRKIPQWEFDFYALALPRGHAFGEEPPVAAWGSNDGNGCGIVTHNPESDSFHVIVMRRRVDSVWTVTKRADGFATIDAAATALEPELADGLALEPLPPGVPMQAPLFDLAGREPSEVFWMLGMETHQPAAWALNQLYLALPRPDRNWVSDCQTTNFHTRLWEAQLLASSRAGSACRAAL